MCHAFMSVIFLVGTTIWILINSHVPGRRKLFDGLRYDSDNHNKRSSSYGVCVSVCVFCTTANPIVRGVFVLYYVYFYCHIYDRNQVNILIT